MLNHACAASREENVCSFGLDRSKYSDNSAVSRVCACYGFYYESANSCIQVSSLNMATLTIKSHKVLELFCFFCFFGLKKEQQKSRVFAWGFSLLSTGDVAINEELEVKLVAVRDIEVPITVGSVGAWSRLGGCGVHGVCWVMFRKSFFADWVICVFFWGLKANFWRVPSLNMSLSRSKFSVALKERGCYGCWFIVGVRWGLICALPHHSDGNF